MTPIEAVFAVIIFYVGLLAGRMGERMRSYRLGAPSIYDQQNRSMEAQQRAVFNFESHEIKNILTGPLSPWQQQMMERDIKDSPGT